MADQGMNAAEWLARLAGATGAYTGQYRGMAIFEVDKIPADSGGCCDGDD